MKFFSFWRSQARFRVRVALNLKKLPSAVVFVDLDADAHRTDDFADVNPQMALPALVRDDCTTLFQSLAIIEYLEETHPTPPLLPKDARGRARVGGSRADRRLRGPSACWCRASADISIANATYGICSRPSGAATGRWKPDGAQTKFWPATETGRFCHGDTPTLADICAARYATTAAMMTQIDLNPLADREAHLRDIHGVAGICDSASAGAARHPRRRCGSRSRAATTLTLPLPLVGEGGASPKGEASEGYVSALVQLSRIETPSGFAPRKPPSPTRGEKGRRRLPNSIVKESRADTRPYRGTKASGLCIDIALREQRAQGRPGAHCTRGPCAKVESTR